MDHRGPTGQPQDSAAVSRDLDLDVPMRALPLLGALATFAAVADLVWNRGVLRALGDDVSRAAQIELVRWGGLPRNLAAVAGLVALSAGLLGFVRSRAYVPLPTRIGLAGFAGVFLPTVFLSTVLPADRTTPHIVLVATGAADVLATLLGLTALRWRGPRGVRLAVGLTTASVMLGFATLVVTLVATVGAWNGGYVLAGALRRTGEVAWLLAPVCLGSTALLRPGHPRFVASTAAGLLAAAMVAAGLLAARVTLGPDFADVFYGATRLELFLESSPMAYVLPLAVGAGVATAAIASGPGPDRQAGVGALLLLCASYAPRSPGLLLTMTLGVLLLSRAATAHATLYSIRRSMPPMREEDF